MCVFLPAKLRNFGRIAKQHPRAEIFVTLWLHSSLQALIVHLIMKERVHYFDFLNIIACMAMLNLHHNGVSHEFSTEPWWPQALIVEVICYWAVPVFFMLSGATLMGYRARYSTADFFKARFKRTFIPFILWSIVWGAFLYMKQKNTIDNFDPSPAIGSLKWWVAGILYTKFQGVYWFFIPLFGLYLLMPMLSSLKNPRRVAIYLASLIFVVTGLVNPLLVLAQWPPVGAAQNAMAGPVMFALLGCIIMDTKVSSKWLWALSIATIGCFVFRYWHIYHFSGIDGKLNELLYDYYYFTSVIPAVTVFALVKEKFPIKIGPSTAKVLKTLSACSLGIYLLHMAVMFGEERLGVDRYSLYYRGVMFFVNYLLCFVIVYLTKKVPFLGKYIFP